MACYQDEEPERKDIRYKPEKADEYVTCPYFPEHELRKSRLPYHLMKCQNHPDAPKLLACPFNYMHRVHPRDQETHLATCEDRVTRRYADRKQSFNSTLKTQPRARAAALSKPIQLPATRVPPETGETEWW